MAEFTTALHGVGNEFSEIGSIYCDDLDKFFVGPMPEITLSESQHGPWKTTMEYLSSEITSILIYWQENYFIRANQKHNFCEAPISGIVKYLGNLSTLLSKFDAKAVMDADGVDTNRSLLHQDLHAHNIFIDPISARLTGIIDWDGADIMPDWRCTVIPKFLQCPEVYCPENPLSRSEEKSRETFMELTHLRDLYILQKCKMEPGFNYRLEKYEEEHKFHSCFSVPLQCLELEDLAEWVEEQLSEYRVNSGKVGAG